MGKIFAGQTALTLTATMNQNVTDATCLIKYRKPSGATGSFVAGIVTAATGVIEYAITAATDIDEAGIWTFWGYITFSGGTVAAGEPDQLEVFTEGT